MDGDTDVLITGLNSAPLLLRNDVKNNHSVRLTLQGAQNNRFAIGARLEALIGNRTVRRTVKSGYSYLSHSELPLTLGLGQANHITRLKIVWPSGKNTKLQNIEGGFAYIIHEDKGIFSRSKLKT